MNQTVLALLALVALVVPLRKEWLAIALLSTGAFAAVLAIGGLA